MKESNEWTPETLSGVWADGAPVSLPKIESVEVLKALRQRPTPVKTSFQEQFQDALDSGLSAKEAFLEAAEYSKKCIWNTGTNSEEANAISDVAHEAFDEAIQNGLPPEEAIQKADQVTSAMWNEFRSLD